MLSMCRCMEQVIKQDRRGFTEKKNKLSWPIEFRCELKLGREVYLRVRGICEGTPRFMTYMGDYGDYMSSKLRGNKIKVRSDLGFLSSCEI